MNFFLQFGSLNPQQQELITQKAQLTHFKKGDYLSEAGKVANTVGFILEGIMRVCFYNNKGEEITRYFIDENNLLVDLVSFENRVPASEYVEAVTDCTIITFSYANWQYLMQTIVGFEIIMFKITQRALQQKIERRTPLVSEDATTRYLSFMEKYPGLINRIPLSQLASYLGITQSSLSRIRKGLS
ncbi:cAMP-binding domain of CRP or a regulatory subunit of cAMP-dependent protein kinases [Flavobacterium akiainvivens]|nr:cAMP-binding domain of CRP or a regulatory subunit of cAMP-dependent protein kinases [Flavobacterium akiainvivens]